VSLPIGVVVSNCWLIEMHETPCFSKTAIILAKSDSADSGTRHSGAPAGHRCLRRLPVGNVIWPLTDHLNTTRDLVDRDELLGTVAVMNHREFDSYGNVVGETNAAVDHLFGFTGRYRDETTGLQNNLNRWYDAAVGQWMNEDPIGFDGGDSSVRRYVGNSPIHWSDPAGLVWGPKDIIRIKGRPSTPAGLPGIDMTIEVTGGATNAQLKALELAVRRALAQLLSAQQLMHKYDGEIIEIFSKSILKIGDCEAFYEIRHRIDGVVAALTKKGAKIHFNLDPTANGNEGLAYVLFIFDIRTGTAINLRPLFFTADENEQTQAIYHELGRFFGWYSGDGIDDPGNDISIWDGAIRAINEQQSLIEHYKLESSQECPKE
jgi:RHS repeat-associated protein